MKRAFAAIGIAIFAASASAQSAPSTADFVKTVAISDMFESVRLRRSLRTCRFSFLPVSDGIGAAPVSAAPTGENRL